MKKLLFGLASVMAALSCLGQGGVALRSDGITPGTNMTFHGITSATNIVGDLYTTPGGVPIVDVLGTGNGLAVQDNAGQPGLQILQTPPTRKLFEGASGGVSIDFLASTNVILPNQSAHPAGAKTIVTAEMLTNMTLSAAGVATNKPLYLDASTNLAGATIGSGLSFSGGTLSATGGGGGSQTPWTNSIDGGGFSLTNVSFIDATNIGPSTFLSIHINPTGFVSPAVNFNGNLGSTNAQWWAQSFVGTNYSYSNVTGGELITNNLTVGGSGTFSNTVNARALALNQGGHPTFALATGAGVGASVTYRSGTDHSFGVTHITGSSANGTSQVLWTNTFSAAIGTTNYSVIIQADDLFSANTIGQNGAIMFATNKTTTSFEIWENAVAQATTRTQLWQFLVVEH